MVLFGAADHLVAENDPDLALARRSPDGLQSGLLRGVRVDARDVALQPTHEEEEPEDRERPHGQHDEKDRLVAGHIRQSVRA